MSSDDDVFALQRFNRFHVRMLLFLQDRVAQAEEKLDALDRELSLRTATDVHNGTVRGDKAERLKILNKGLEKLVQYGQYSLAVYYLIPYRVYNRNSMTCFVDIQN